MYTPHTITLILAEEQNDGTMAYNPVILSGVFLDLNKRSNVNRSGLADADSATLFIPFSTVGKSFTGQEKQYIAPKAYEALTDKSGYWTLKDGGDSSAVECYFIKSADGNFDLYYGSLADVALADVDVVDDDTTIHSNVEFEGYREMQRRYDYVYAVTSVDLRDFGRSSMQHFQVGGK